MKKMNLESFFNQSVLTMDSYDFFQKIQHSEKLIAQKNKDYENGKHWLFSFRYSSVFFSFLGSLLIFNNHSYGFIFTALGLANVGACVFFSRKQWTSVCKVLPGYKKLVAQKEHYYKQLIFLLSKEKFQFELIHMFREFIANLNSHTMHVANDYALDSIKKNINARIEVISHCFAHQEYENALTEIQVIHQQIETLEKSLKKQTYMNQYYQRLNTFLDHKQQIKDKYSKTQKASVDIEFEL